MTVGKRTVSVTERNGLCSNAVSGIAADGRGNLWGATDNGVFHVLFPLCSAVIPLVKV